MTERQSATQGKRQRKTESHPNHFDNNNNNNNKITWERIVGDGMDFHVE
jgi:hypothetical protein